MAPTTPPPLTADLLAGLGITVWYALPDYTRSRPLRIAAKSAILAISAVYGAASIRRQGGEALDDAAPEPGAESERSTTRLPEARADGTAPPAPASGISAKAYHPLVFPLAAVAILGGGAAFTVGMERFVYRFGERLAGRGVHLPHSRIGLVLGVVSTAATLGADAMRTRTGPAGDRSASRV